jgi:hypothetical protein
MAEIIIKAVSATHSDQTIDRSGCYKKGFPVVIMPDNHLWGSSEGLPKFVIVKISGTSVETLQAYLSDWRDNFSYTVQSTNPAQGRYTVTVSNSTVSLSGQNKLTLAKVNVFLTRWACENISAGDGSVQFDIRLWYAVRSDAFWNVDDVASKVNFTLVSYNSTTGIGRISATVPSGWSRDVVVAKIVERGGSIVLESHPNYTFDINRADLFEKFKQSVKNATESIFCRRKFYVTEAVVDNIISQGGTISITWQQFLNYIKNKLDD